MFDAKCTKFPTFKDELLYDTKLYAKSIPGMYTPFEKEKKKMFLRADKIDLLFYFN